MPDPEPPALTVAAVARRLGIAPSTLRTWERRYGLGPADRAAGSRRRYLPADVATFEHMRRLTLEGVTPAEAARVARHGAQPETESGPGGPGGRVLAIPQAPPRTRGLARAASALDAAAVGSILRGALAESGVLATWELMLVPVLEAARERVEESGAGEEVGQLLAACLVEALHQHTGPVTAPLNHRCVLVTTAPGDPDALPLHAVAAALAERGVTCRMFGAGLPAAALLSAVRRTGPAAILVWSSTPDTAEQVPLGELPATRPPTAAIVLGPGWDPGRVPGRAALAYDLGDAVHLVQVAVGVG